MVFLKKLFGIIPTFENASFRHIRGRKVRGTRWHKNFFTKNSFWGSKIGFLGLTHDLLKKLFETFLTATQLYETIEIIH